MSLDLYELYSPRFLNAPGLSWQAALKNTKVKLDLLIDIDMSLLVDKGIRGRIFYVIHRYIKASSTYMKNQYQDIDSLYRWAMSQKLLVEGFTWVKNTSQFNKDFMKNLNEHSDEGYFFVADVKYSKNLHILHHDYNFYLKK